MSAKQLSTISLPSGPKLVCTRPNISRPTTVRIVHKSLVPSFGGKTGGEGAPPVGLRATEDYPGAAAHHPTSVHYLRGQQTNTNVNSIPPENILQMFPMTRNLKVRPMDLIQNGDGHMNIFSTVFLVQYTLMFPQSTQRNNFFYKSIG